MKNVKGNIFIGWGGDNTLARAVAESLKKADFSGIVGGNSGGNINSATIADTVINQIKKSNGAIMLFTEKNFQSSDGAVIKNLSANMLFEFGYALSKLGTQRVLVIYIDVRDELIPTDMLGMWDMKLSANGKTTEQLAEEIVKNFVSERRNFDFGDKLMLMSRPEYIHSLLRQHMESPKYGNDEIAEIVIIFSQTAYIFDDFVNANNLLDELASKARESMEQSYKLSCAYRLAKIYFDLSTRMADSNDGGTKLYLSRHDYDKFIDDLTDLIDYIGDMEENADDKSEKEYIYMFLAVAYEYITFANMIYYADRPLEELGEEVIKMRVEYCDLCISYCDKLTETDEHNENFANLFKGYTYRNLALLYKKCNPGECDENFEESIRLRRDINREFGKNSTVNKHFASQMEMEYFLSLSDNLYLKSDSEKQKRKIALQRYVDKMQQKKYDKFYHIETIKRRIQ